jgi:hypothetical protein
MGFSLPFGKQWKMQKLIGRYVKARVREKRAFEEQIRRLDAQLHDKQINKQIHERLRGILETQYYQKQQEQWTNVKSKFQNPFN